MRSGPVVAERLRQHPDLYMARRYREAGADQLILPAAMVPEAELLPALDRWADYLEVAP